MTRTGETDVSVEDPNVAMHAALKNTAQAAVLIFGDAQGDVQVTCASPMDFIFSTVESKMGRTHPVAGNRGFGIKDNSDSTWTLYSKATDRQSDSKLNFVPNHTPRDVFCRGHKFWLSFYDYLNGQGLKVKEVSSTNHGTVKFPFDAGAPPLTQRPCN